jgi:uncharacterized protein
MAKTIGPPGQPRIIDTDTHFTEPPDLWTSRLPKKWGKQVMHVVRDEARGADVWCVGDRMLTKAFEFCQFGFPKPFPETPNVLSDCHPSTVDQSERVRLMDEQGVRAAVLYPNVGGLSASHFVNMPPKISIAHCSAYNDYLLEWSHNFPGRFIPMLVVPFWDVAAAVAEIERMEDKGFGGVVSSGAPQNHSQPFLSDPHWDPMWQACVDANLSVSYHVGNGGLGDEFDVGRKKSEPPRSMLPRVSTINFLNVSKQITDLLLSGVLAKFPTLQFVSVESGIGWIPFVLESLDYHFHKAGSGKDEMLPSELFRRQVYVNYWFERLEQWHIDVVGEDRILFETDFPHPTCLGPDDVRQNIEVGLAAQPGRLREKILWGNASKLYSIPPLP